jgi:hypothetical protein
MIEGAGYLAFLFALIVANRAFRTLVEAVEIQLH